MEEIKHIGAYAIGLRCGGDPSGTIADMVKVNMKENLEAMIQGFDQGRSDLLKYNGLDAVSNPPLHVLNVKALSDFSINGLLDIAVDTDEYNTTQLLYITDWYGRGEKQRKDKHKDWILELFVLLEQRGIVLTD